MPSDLINGYSQEELDAQYDLRALITDWQSHVDHYNKLSEEARQTLPVELDIAYGEAPGERLDIFPAASAGAPVHMFIHGGYWRSLDKAQFDFVALGLGPADVTVAVINYDLAPAASLDDILRQCRKAAVWLHDNAERYRGNGQNLHVGGHSAGGQLAAMVLATDWPNFTDGRIEPGLIKSMAGISGLYDLEVMRFTYLNSDLQLDAASASRNSPLLLARHLPKPHVPIHLAVGADETDEFHRHFGRFAMVLEEAGVPVTGKTMADHQHFSIVAELANPHSPLTIELAALTQDSALPEMHTI